MEEIDYWLKKYEEWNINIIPLKERDKRPIIRWDEYKKRKTTEGEIRQWREQGGENFAAICGSISNDLLVIDIDNEELFSKLNLRELVGETFTVRTGKGYHIYLRMKEPGKRALAWQNKEEVRFQGEGKYVVIAGSIHPTGRRYEHYATSPLEIKNSRPGLLDEIERK